ncbi:MAG: ribosome biogenesis GTPase YlqF [Eubacteriales bacterium]|nr:ribosome biogenesis GTPase YlqF [Eubacteriales bacterium]
MNIHWYPGHMTKARRMMEENIKLVDLVIELADARIPESSRNPDIGALCAGKARVLVLNKADLADPVCIRRYVEAAGKDGVRAIAMDARSRRGMEELRAYVREACAAKLARDKRRGIVGRPLRAMVAGIPNVGKSTFINSFAGKACTKTGNKPGVTKGKQWIRMAKDIELLDTPGILWPKFEDPQTGIRLALAGAINEDILEPVELSFWLLRCLEQSYPGAVAQRYGIGAGTAAEQSAAANETVTDGGDSARLLGILTQIAQARGLVKAQGAPDTGRAATVLLDDFKNGRLGKITLEP